MPPVIIPAIAAGISVGFQISVTAGLIAAAATAALGAVTYALREEPELPNFRDLSAGLQISSIDAAQPRRILYGRNRVGGQIVLRAVSGEDNAAFHQILVWAGHEVEAIETLYAGDEAIPQTYATLTATDISFQDLGDDMHSLTTDLDAVFTDSGMVFEVTGATDDMNGIFRIKNTYQEDTSTQELNLVRLDGGPFNDMAGGPSVTLTETYSRVSSHLGAAGQAADTLAVRDIAAWSTAHTLAGCAYSYVTLYYSAKHWKAGLPNITAVFQGKQCYDPRDATTHYTRNPALIARDWLTDTTYGLGVPTANIDDTSVSAAANICDENVTTTAGTVDRYTCDAVIRANENKRDVLARMAASMAGYIVQTGATWTFKAGAYESPTITLDESDLRGPVQIMPRRSRQELFNSVKAGYRDATLNYQPTDMPHVQDSGALAQDNAEELWKTLRFDYSTDRESVVRLAKIALLRNRDQLQVKLRVGLEALAITAGDTIALSIDRYSWASKAFFVEEWRLAPYSDERGAPALGIELGLRETSAAAYSWDAGEASPTPAPASLPVPDWASMDAPSGLTLASGTDQLLIAGDGTLISRIKVTWGLAAGAFASKFELRYRRSADTQWTYITSDAPTSYIAPVNDLDQYDIGVRAYNALGVPSDWTSIAGYVVIGKTAPPRDVDSFTVVRLADGTRRLSWTQSPVDDDVRVGGGYRIKYQSGSSITWASASALHTGLLGASPFETNQLAAGTYTFAIVAVDSTGNESATPLSLTVTLGDPRLQNVLIQRIEQDLDWPGTLSNGIVSPDNTLVEGGTWSALAATWAALADRWSDITGGGGITYETEVIDVGADTTFTPLVTSTGLGTHTIEMKTGTEADGTVTGTYAALAQVAGKRYIQIRVTTNSPASVVSLVTLLDAETLADEYEDVDIATEAASWFERVAAGHFRIAARKSVAGISFAEVSAIQNITTPHTWGLVSKSATVTGNPNPAAEFKVWDNTGTLADALVDVLIKGPKST